MRTILAELDSAVGLAFAAGVVIGIVWLAWPGPGVVAGALVLALAAMILTIRRRWLELGAFLIGMGSIPAVGYLVLGAPPVPPSGASDVVLVEAFAPGAAWLMLISGLAIVVGITAQGWRETRRREDHLSRRAARKRRIVGDPS